jgi:hypothetical protein
VAKAKASQSKTGRALSAVSYNRKQFGARRKIDHKPKVSAKAQRQRRASLEGFNERMQAKGITPGAKRVGFGADTDVSAVGFTTSPGAVRPPFLIKCHHRNQFAYC